MSLHSSPITVEETLQRDSVAFCGGCLDRNRETWVQILSLFLPKKLPITLEQSQSLRFILLTVVLCLRMN